MPTTRLAAAARTRTMRTCAALGATLLAAAAAGAQRAPDTFTSLARESLARIDGRVALAGLRDSVEVVRDRWGVPHIYARNIDDLFFAQGFVQAQDRLWQMEMYRRTYEGTLAEIMGPDVRRSTTGSRGCCSSAGPFDDREWTSYHPEGRRIFDAFAAGVNAFIAHAGDRLPVEFRLTGITTAAVDGRDRAAAHADRDADGRRAGRAVASAQIVARLGADSANRAAQPVAVPRRSSCRRAWTCRSSAPRSSRRCSGLRTGTVRPPLLPQYRAHARRAASREPRRAGELAGQQQLGGERRDSPRQGNVIVANDPHRNVANPSIRYIVHLNAPGWNVIGATEPPLPGVMIGHNGRIGWGLTIVGTDQADVYVEEVNPANHDQVRFRGAWEADAHVSSTRSA